MLGALYRYLREADPKHFQPMNANFGLVEPLMGKVKKDRKKELLVERAQTDFSLWLEQSEVLPGSSSLPLLQHEGTKDTKDHKATILVLPHE
jgi:hypothetical protein